MTYLVLKTKGYDDYLYTQSKKDRDSINEIAIELGQEIDTVVVKVFDTQAEADKYCLDINSVSEILNHLF